MVSFYKTHEYGRFWDRFVSTATTLVGEQRYTYGPDQLRPIAFLRQARHAQRLAFRHPADGRELRFEAPLPPDFVALLSRLRRRWRS